jgi:hypothetical protein
MLFSRVRLLFWSRLVLDAARPARIGSVVLIDDGGVMHNRLVHVGCVNNRRIHIHDCGVIGKVPATPFPTGKTHAHVAKAVVHAAVVANVLAPVTFVEDIVATTPAPVSGSPEIARLRSGHPCSRNPVVIANAVPGPIAGSPHEVRLRTGRLDVNRKSGRLDIDVDAYGELREASRWHQEECQNESLVKESHTEGVHPKPPISHIRAWF